MFVMKNDKIFLGLFLLIGVVLFGMFFVRFKKDFLSPSEGENKEISSISLYGYTLQKKDTEVFKTNFKELENVLNEDVIDYKKYAMLLSKLFVIDVFTLNNKLASTDIGGGEYLHKDIKDNFNENMGASLYKFMQSNIDGKRTQELPQVKSVVVDNVFETKFNYNDKEYDSYLVSLSWEYEKDLGYQNTIKLTLINENNMLYVVKGE